MCLLVSLAYSRTSSGSPCDLPSSQAAVLGHIAWGRPRNSIKPVEDPSPCLREGAAAFSLLSYPVGLFLLSVVMRFGKHPNGTVGSTGLSGATAASSKPEYDPTFTDKVIAATGPNAQPRLAQIMPSLIRHLHDFAREVDLTVDEWMTGIELV